MFREEIVIYSSRWKTVILALVSFLFLLISVCEILNDMDKSHDEVSLFGLNRFLPDTIFGIPQYKFIPNSWWSVCLFLIFQIILGLSMERLIKHRPVWIISEKGIHTIHLGMINWWEIDDIYIQQFGKQKRIVIKPLNVKNLMMRQSIMRRMIMYLNILLEVPQVSIKETILPMGIEELKIRIKNYKQKKNNRIYSQIKC